MLKRMIAMAILALGVFAASYVADDPAPDCFPCPDVR
jgi:hypothetical protein